MKEQLPAGAAVGAGGGQGLLGHLCRSRVYPGSPCGRMDLMVNVLSEVGEIPRASGGVGSPWVADGASGGRVAPGRLCSCLQP